VTDWIEIVVPVGAADVDDVAALVASEVTAAAAGTELRGDEVVFWVAADTALAALEETRAAVARWGIDPARVRTEAAVPESEWRDAWKKYFKVSRLTRQIVVVPSWESYESAPGDVRIDLDPGMAFGTGTHASTRLVLEEMQALADAGLAPDRILDVGCGSGILSIAAVKLWPGTTCIAVDNDPLAVAATTDNAAHNGVTARVDARAELPAGTFPLVLANIQAHVLRELKDVLVAHSAGTLILSGLLTPQAAPLAAEFGMKIVRIRASADDAQWSSVTLER
jgi:ribosomal protein L11 methyltransferase